MTTNEQWRSTTALRTALVWLLSANIAATVLAGVALEHANEVADDYYHYRQSYASTRDANQLFAALAVGLLALLVATGIVFIVWMWRSVKNNELLDRIRPRYTSGWSIGGWFIPIASLWIPVRIMHDLWQGSDPEITGHRDWRGLRRTALIGWWWGLYLLSHVLTVTPFGVVTTSSTAVLAIVLVRRITERQLVARDLQPSFPSGWYADPTHRFDHRYWNGLAWTDHASRSGEALVDPLG